MEMINKFFEHEKYACIYYAYNTIQKYLVSGYNKLLCIILQYIHVLHGSYRVFMLFMALVCFRMNHSHHICLKRFSTFLAF